MRPCVHDLPTTSNGIICSDGDGLQDVRTPVAQLIARSLGVGLGLTWLWLAVQSAAWALGAGSHRIEPAAVAFGSLLALASLMAPWRTFDGNVARPSTPILVAVLATLVLVGYWGIWATGFLSDDFVLLSWARNGDLLTAGYEHLRPIPIALWALIVRAGGGAETAHALSLTLHTANAVGVSRLASKMGLTEWSSTATGAVFALWPLGAEPVAWVAATPDLLVTAAVIGSTMILLSDRATVSASLALLAVSTIACLSKETGVATPFVAAMLAYAARGHWVRTVALVPAASIAGAYAAYRLAYAPSDFVTSMTAYDFKEFIVRPFESLLIPVHGAVAEQARWAFACVNIGLTAFLTWRMRDALRLGAPALPVAPLLAAVLISVAPLQRYLHISADLEGIRYLYCAAVPWTLLLGSLLSSLRGPTILRRVGFTLVVLVATAMLRSNLRPWFEAATLRDEVLAKVQAFSRAAPACPAFRVTGAPDVVRGAQVFRNGLPEALAAEMPHVRLDPHAPHACTLSLDSARPQGTR